MSQEAENQNSNPRAVCSGFLQSKKPSKGDIAHKEGVDSLLIEREKFVANVDEAVDADNAIIQRLFWEGIDDKTIVGMRNGERLQPRQKWQS